MWCRGSHRFITPLTAKSLTAWVRVLFKANDLMSEGLPADLWGTDGSTPTFVWGIAIVVIFGHCNVSKK